MPRWANIATQPKKLEKHGIVLNDQILRSLAKKLLMYFWNEAGRVYWKVEEAEQQYKGKLYSNDEETEIRCALMAESFIRLGYELDSLIQKKNEEIKE